MNKKVLSIKKSFINICSKILNTNNSSNSADLSNEHKQINGEATLFRKNFDNKVSSKQRKYTKKIANKKLTVAKCDSVIYAAKSTVTSSGVSSAYGVVTNDIYSYKQPSCSSGYTSGSQIYSNDAQSKRFDDEVKSIRSLRVTENNDEEIAVHLTKLNIINYLLDFQVDYLSALKNGLENFIRPLSALISHEMYFNAFQNIEKIFSMSQFIRNSIVQNMHLSTDLYQSTVAVINEYISLIKTAYEIYLQGYSQSCMYLKTPKVVEIIEMFKKNNDCVDFDVFEFIDLPLNNLTKIYCSFNSLMELTSSTTERDEYEKLSKICASIKQLLIPIKCLDETQSSGSTELDNTNTESISFKFDVNEFIYDHTVKSRRPRRHHRSSKKSAVCSKRKHNSSKVASSRPHQELEFLDASNGVKYYYL